jgi:hypothetical protein
VSLCLITTQYDVPALPGRGHFIDLMRAIKQGVPVLVSDDIV